jgi:hypothetical protein
VLQLDDPQPSVLATNDHLGEPDGEDTEAFFAALPGADGADVAAGPIRILTGPGEELPGRLGMA